MSAIGFQCCSATTSTTVRKPLNVLFDFVASISHGRINSYGTSDRAKEKSGYHPIWLKNLSIRVGEFPPFLEIPPTIARTSSVPSLIVVRNRVVR